jgi:hypothetical protein
MTLEMRENSFQDFRYFQISKVVRGRPSPVWLGNSSKEFIGLITYNIKSPSFAVGQSSRTFIYLLAFGAGPKPKKT